MDLPEYRSVMEKNGHRRDVVDIQCVQSKGKELGSLLGEPKAWVLNGDRLNHAAILKARRRPNDIANKLAELLEQCPSVRKVWTRAEIESPSPDPFHQLYRNSYYRERSPDFFVQLEENHLSSSGTGTSHGSPYHYDTKAPLIFWTPETEPARIDARVAPVDIAPTLASYLGLPIPGSVEGKDLTRFLKTR
jgi:hypothetical protein